MSSIISEPFSLEDQCLLHLICHLEDYLPETLASLPLHLRHRLLLNLPAADVCQLENTAVSAGINMEDIWRELTREQANTGEHYLCSNSHWLLFDGDFFPHKKTKAKTLLFSAIGCLGVTNWDCEGIQHPFALIGSDPIPYRYVRYFSQTEECQRIELLSFLVEKCNWSPVQLTIYGTQFATIRLWKEHERYAKSLQKFLCMVQELKFCNYKRQEQWKKWKCSIVRFILKHILVNPQTALSKLHLKCYKTDFPLDTVAKFFSPTTDSDPLYSHSNIPYSGLSSIGVCLPTPDLCPHLQSMVRYQTTLTSVHIAFTHQGNHGNHALVSLVATLGLLFHQPQFKELRLKGMEMTWEHLSVLLPPFLSASSSKDNPKVLELTRVEFPESATPPEPVAIITGSGVNSPPQKAIKFNPDYGILRFLHWLSAYDYTSLLSSITVDLHYSNPPHPIHLPDKPTNSLQHLQLRHARLERSPDRVFQSPRLKTVCLAWCGMGPDGHLPALTQGLRRQLSVGSIEELSLEGNKLGASPEPELLEFFDVLFSLPQLSNLELNLSYNCLTPHRFSLMHDSWRRNAGQLGKQLKTLKVEKHNEHTFLEYIQHFARNVAPLPCISCQSKSSQ